MKRIGIVFLLIFISLNVIFTQNLVLPKIFSDNMVLQREVAIPFWGWGDPGKTVKIKLQNQSVSATIDADGKWRY